MLYVFVDPSGSFIEGKGHTGISTMLDDDWNTLEIKSIAAKDFKERFMYWKSIIEEIVNNSKTYSNNILVIIESFQIRTNGFLLGKMPETIMLIGALVWELEQLGIPYIFQTPSQAKSRFKDDILNRYIPNFRKKNGRYYLNGKQTNDHVRDALKHLLYFKKYHKER